LAKLEESAKTPQEKSELAKKFAEVGIKYDEAGRKGGRFSSAINYFYKKSPLGIQMIENAKRKQAFEEWAKPKDKSWKEFFDEMMKEPEFEEQVKEQVKEGLKKERAEARAARIKKVDEFFDKAKDEFKGGAAYSTIIPPKVITTALEGMRQAYHAGEKVAEIVQKAIDYISEQLGSADWDKEKFRKEWTEKLKDKETKKPLTDEEIKAKILDKFRKKLKGLTDNEKEELVRKSFQKIVESGGLDYTDFKKIIADITGRGEFLYPTKIKYVKRA
jgi:transketolase